MLQSAYAPKDGQPKGLPSVIAYLDVLGFTQEIRAFSATGQSDVLLQRFISVIRKWYDSFRDQDVEGKRPRIWELKAFTDNLVMGHPIRWDGEIELGHVLSDVALLQLGLAQEGFFVRGGIAVGDLYMDEDVVFGVGLLDAYSAEQAADAPRVILAPSAVSFVKQHVRYYASVEISPQNEDLFVDEVGQFVVNYLSSVWPDRTEAPFYEWFEIHRKVVVAKLDLHRAEPRVWPKYAWVARYHNYFCDTLPGGGEHKIDVSLFALGAKRLQDVV